MKRLFLIFIFLESLFAPQKLSQASFSSSSEPKSKKESKTSEEVEFDAILIDLPEDFISEEDFYKEWEFVDYQIPDIVLIEVAFYEAFGFWLQIRSGQKIIDSIYLRESRLEALREHHFSYYLREYLLGQEIEINSEACKVISFINFRETIFAVLCKDFILVDIETPEDEEAFRQEREKLDPLFLSGEQENISKLSSQNFSLDLNSLKALLIQKLK